MLITISEIINCTYSHSTWSHLETAIRADDVVISMIWCKHDDFFANIHFMLNDEIVRTLKPLIN